jgi:DNA-binding protein H-NS
MTSLKELLSQKQALEAQIEITRNKERADAIAKVHALMSEYGLSLADLGTKRAPKTAAPKAASKVPVKYRDSATGDTWSGRGLQPKWLKAALAAGRKLGDFTV